MSTGVIFDDGADQVQSRYWGLGTGLSISYDATGRPVLDFTSSPGGDHDIGDHADTVFGTLTVGDLIQWSGTAWVDVAVLDLNAHSAQRIVIPVGADKWAT